MPKIRPQSSEPEYGLGGSGSFPVMRDGNKEFGLFDAPMTLFCDAGLQAVLARPWCASTHTHRSTETDK